MSSDGDHLLTGAYVLDALDTEERAAFTEHLRGCAQCRQEVAELGSVVDRLDLDPAVQPPVGLRDRVLAQVAQEARPAPSRSGSPLLFVAAAAVLVLVVVAVVRLTAGGPVQEVLAAEDAAAVTLVGEDIGDARVVVDPGRGDAVLEADLPPLEPPQVYTVWVIDEQGPEARRSLEPEPGEQVQTLVADVRGAQALAVSVETPPVGDEPQGRIIGEATLP